MVYTFDLVQLYITRKYYAYRIRLIFYQMDKKKLFKFPAALSITNVLNIIYITYMLTYFY